MRAHMTALLYSTAFANAGAQAMATYQNSPDTTPLRAAVDALNDAAGVMDASDLLKRAPDMEAMLEYWDQTDDIINGQKAVVSKRTAYLPQFSDETNKDYDVRLKMTKFTNVYRDVVESLAAKPFEREIALVDTDGKTSPPEQITEFIENVDGTGNNITIFGANVMFNGINSAIDWIFVDNPKIDTETIRTKADEKRAGIRPFWTRVPGRNVLEARTVVGEDGKRQLSYIRVFEPGIDSIDHVRIFERTNDNRVIWFLYVKIKDETALSGKFRLEESGTLGINRIPFVPFITGRRDGASFKVFPAMQDAADLQIKLYQNESGLEFICNMAAYPMLAANGMRPQLEADGKTPKKVAIGPNRMLWGIPDGNGNHGSWAYVEPSATTMKFLEDKIKNTKQDLRELGRQPLTANSGNLTVITTAVAAGKSRSAVAAWALALKDTLENALVITGLFMGGLNGYDPEVSVYTEFDNFTDNAADLTELGNARRNGDLSRETYWSELKRRKVLAAEFTATVEETRLLNEVPSDKNLDLENADDQQ